MMHERRRRAWGLWPITPNWRASFAHCWCADACLEIEEWRETSVDFVEHFWRYLSDDFHLARLAIDAPNVIDEDDACDRQTWRQFHFHRPASFAAGDRTDDGQTRALMIARGRQHDSPPPSCLFATRLRRKKEPNQAASIRQRHQMCSSPAGASSSSTYSRSAGIPARKSSSVKRTYA